MLRNWSLIGIPDHTGVFHVGGRLGTADGPRAFRRVFGRLKGREPVQDSLLDLGDVKFHSPGIVDRLEQASQEVFQGHSQSGLSVVVGGGHDHGYSHLVGIRRFLESTGRTRLGCINIDAHLDVRKPAPVITSGSPFYLALESNVVHPDALVEFGIQEHCNGPELWEFVESLKVQVVPFEALRNGNAASSFRQALNRLAAQCDCVVISLDMDAAAAAFAPGVSAPQAEGFTSTDILEMVEIAGDEPKVVSLGIFELNPLHDVDDRTARLAATAAFHFVARALRR